MIAKYEFWSKKKDKWCNMLHKNREVFGSFLLKNIASSMGAGDAFNAGFTGFRRPELENVLIWGAVGALLLWGSLLSNAAFKRNLMILTGNDKNYQVIENYLHEEVIYLKRGLRILSLFIILAMVISGW